MCHQCRLSKNFQTASQCKRTLCDQLPLLMGVLKHKGAGHSGQNKQNYCVFHPEEIKSTHFSQGEAARTADSTWMHAAV